MNKVILMGRLVKDPELKPTQNNISVCTFTLAVDRRFKNQQGERETDFIPCVAWRQTAEFVAKYFSKGARMSLVGSMQVRSWDDNGSRRFITEVIADEVYFADSKRSDNDSGNNYQSNYRQNQTRNTDFSAKTQVPEYQPDEDDVQLPFDL